MANTYKIKSGDSLSKIAKEQGTTVSSLMAANPNISDPNKIYAGATLNLPGVSSGGSGGSSSKTSSGSSGSSRVQTMNLSTSSGVREMQTYLNTLGAGLVVDGVMGPKTQAAIDRYGNRTSSTTGGYTPAPSGGTQRPTNISQLGGYDSLMSAVNKGKSSGVPTTGTSGGSGLFKNIVSAAKKIITQPSVSDSLKQEGASIGSLSGAGAYDSISTKKTPTGIVPGVINKATGKTKEEQTGITRADTGFKASSITPGVNQERREEIKNLDLKQKDTGGEIKQFGYTPDDRVKLGGEKETQNGLVTKTPSFLSGKTLPSGSNAEIPLDESQINPLSYMTQEQLNALNKAGLLSITGSPTSLEEREDRAKYETILELQKRAEEEAYQKKVEERELLINERRRQQEEEQAKTTAAPVSFGEDVEKEDDTGQVDYEPMLKQMSVGLPSYQAPSYLNQATSDAMGILGSMSDNITRMKNEPFSDKSYIDGDIATYTDSYLSRVGHQFRNGNDLMYAYANDTAFREKMDSALASSTKYRTIQDLAGDITPLGTVNMVPQTNEEYLSALGGYISGSDPYTQMANKQLDIMTQFLSQSDMSLYQEAIAEREHAITQKEILNKNLARAEAREEERAEWMKEKLKAEYQAQSYEIEEERLKMKSYMTGLLAHLGALDVSGSAGLALSRLDAKYTQMKVGITSQYNNAVREIELNMGDKMYELRNNYEMNILKISYDLNKTNREIDRELSKLKYEFSVDSIKIRMDRDSKLEAANERALKAQLKAAEYWYEGYFTESGLQYFGTMDKDYQQEIKQGISLGSLVGPYDDPVNKMTKAGSDKITAERLADFQKEKELAKSMTIKLTPTQELDLINFVKTNKSYKDDPINQQIIIELIREGNREIIEKIMVKKNK